MKKMMGNENEDKLRMEEEEEEIAGSETKNERRCR